MSQVRIPVAPLKKNPFKRMGFLFDDNTTKWMTQHVVMTAMRMTTLRDDTTRCDDRDADDHFVDDAAR